MAQLREIKKRIKAVGNIQRITKTMQMIATAKFQASIRRAQATKPFTQKISEMVSELAGASGDRPIDHPLLSSPETATGQKILLVVTSNRGLCGAYNAHLLRAASHFLRDQGDEKTHLHVIGKKGGAFFRFAGQEIAQSYNDFTDKVPYESIEAIADQFIKQYETGTIDSVHVIYMKFISNAKQSAQVAKLLPLDRPDASEQSTDSDTNGEAIYDFSPSPDQLLRDLLPLTVKSQLFQYINDAIVSEQIARMIAMKAATDNAGKMRHALSRTFNRARQAQITTELTEIISGAAALE